MSIYPVKLAAWFPKKDEHCMLKVIQGYPCMKCGNTKHKYTTVIAHHSLPWGYGDVWCNAKCYRSTKRKGRI